MWKYSAQQHRFVLVFIVQLIGLCTSQNAGCMDTHWSLEAKDCDEGMTEIYRDHDPASNKWSTRCCQPGTPGEANEKLYAKDCKVTRCVPEQDSNKNFCETEIAWSRYVDGVKLEYEETVRDRCDSNGGTEALCCIKNSTDVLLTTLYGVEPHEFPHFARLGTGGCGGTLYNSKWVITASHCVVDASTHEPFTPDHPDWNWKVGTVRFNIEIGNAYTEDTYKVKRVVVHPESSLLKPLDEFGRQYNDVALLELESEVKFNENVKALKIAEKGFKPEKYADNVVIVGFGTTDTLRLSQKLQKANLLIRDKAKVFDRRTNLGFMRDYKDQLLPVGGIWDGSVSSSVGEGDSGGPGICKDENGDAILCGITSFVGPMPECKKYLNETYCIPSIYSSVEYFRDWIVENAGGQNENDLMKKKLYGYPADDNSYLSQVHVTADKDVTCTGTLLSQDLVITAASCVAEDDGTPKNVKVTSGVRDLRDTKMAKEHNVLAVVLIEGFARVSKGGGGTRKKRVVSLPLEAWKQKRPNTPVIMADPFYKNDLAILKLNGNAIGHPAKIGSPSKPGSMANELSFPRQNKFGQELSVREMKILSNEDCQKRLDRLTKMGYNVELDENLICGVETYSGGSLCDRERGGGLFCKDENENEILCGVQVFRLCEFNIPNAFINMGSVQQWVEAAKKALSEQN